jgi:RNA polymerase sigma factor (sigma-70 family)
MKSTTAKFFSHSFDILVQKHTRLFEQPIIQLFLHDPKGLQIFMDTVDNPTLSNIHHLNEEFQLFYYRARVYKYLCSLIYYFSVDFDKRNRKQKERYPVIFDQSVEGDFSISDKIGYMDKQLEKIGETNELSSLVSDEGLHQAFRKLTIKQEQVLTMAFSYGLSNKEIAAYFDETPQNISSIRKQALKKIRKHYPKGENTGKKEKNCG